MIATVVNELAAARRFTDLSVDFTAEVLNRDATRIGESFSVDIELVISTTTLPMSGELKRLKVAVQQTISSNPAGLRLENITRQGSMLPLNLPLCSPATSNHRRVVMDSPHTQVQGSKQIRIPLPSPYNFSSNTHPVPASVSTVAHQARTSTISPVGGGERRTRKPPHYSAAPSTYDDFHWLCGVFGSLGCQLRSNYVAPRGGEVAGGGKVTIE